MTQLRRFLFAAALLFNGAGHAESLLFIATSPVPPGKFHTVAEVGAKYGFKVESRFAERLTPAESEKLLTAHDAVFFFFSRSHR